ncbi:hypothetical protein MYU51_002463, partial [Penicillium brevicompactum]
CENLHHPTHIRTIMEQPEIFRMREKSQPPLRGVDRAGITPQTPTEARKNCIPRQEKPNIASQMRVGTIGVTTVRRSTGTL